MAFPGGITHRLLLTLSATSPGHPSCPPVRSLKLTEENESIVIGRASSRRRGSAKAAPDNGFLRNPVISREHAKFSYRNSSVYIKDCKSYHGTSLNGVSLPPGLDVLVQNGDDVEFAILTGKLAETMSSCRFSISISDLISPVEPDTPNKTGTYRAPVFLSDDESDVERAPTKGEVNTATQDSEDAKVGVKTLPKASFTFVCHLGNDGDAELPVESIWSSDGEASHLDNNLDTGTSGADIESEEFASSESESIGPVSGSEENDKDQDSLSEQGDEDDEEDNDVAEIADFDEEITEQEDETMRHIHVFESHDLVPYSIGISTQVPQYFQATYPAIKDDVSCFNGRSNNMGEASMIPISYLLTDNTETLTLLEHDTSPSPSPENENESSVCVCESKQKSTDSENCEKSRIMTPPTERGFEHKMPIALAISPSPPRKRKFGNISTETDETQKDSNGAKTSISQLETVSINPMLATSDIQSCPEALVTEEETSTFAGTMETSTTDLVPTSQNTDHNQTSNDDTEFRPRKRLRTVVEAVGFAALGGAAASLAILTALIATAPDLG
ncbi:hypothetical protein BROUX41_003760 [Berkeleyomyces rouxiae]|uniref:uncharacterized protein n=1 Tax=Berkeleyomyces rouxiae TaxID=2035830 RepID=UPI003B8102E0